VKILVLLLVKMVTVSLVSAKWSPRKLLVSTLLSKNQRYLFQKGVKGKFVFDPSVAVPFTGCSLPKRGLDFVIPCTLLSRLEAILFHLLAGR
jgi:hypothetical protein